VQLLLPRSGLDVLADEGAVLAGRVGVDPECVDPEVLAHRDSSAAPLDVVEARDLHLRLVVHPITSVRGRAGSFESSIVAAANRLASALRHARRGRLTVKPGTTQAQARKRTADADKARSRLAGVSRCAWRGPGWPGPSWLSCLLLGEP